MATNTTNFTLKKPEYTDTADINDINGNMDKVDTSLQGMGSGLAIISKNNTHEAVTAGQYVYVHGHGSLAEGLYKATQNIAANGTLSNSNLSAVSSGGLNALFDSLFLTKASVTNANDDLENGVYYCTSATQNVPSGGLYGCMLNLRTAGANSRRIQLLIFTTNLWFRFGQVSDNVLTWNSWMKITATAV